MKKILLSLLSITICISLSACSQSQTADNDVTVDDQTAERNVPQKEDITINETYASSEDGEHAIEASGETASYSNIKVERPENHRETRPTSTARMPRYSPLTVQL